MQQSQSTSRHMLSNPDLTRVSERRRYLKKVKPNKHRGLLNALKTGPDQTKRLRSCFIESRDQLKSRTSRSCACIRPLNSRGVKRSLSIGRNIEIQRRGTIQACRENATHPNVTKLVVTKVHIRNALMGWRANKYVSTMQEFQEVRSAGEVPVAASLLTKHIFKDSFLRASSGH